MSFLPEGSSALVAVAAGQSIAVGAVRGGTANVTFPVGYSKGPSSTVNNGTATYGPFATAATVTVYAAQGTAEYVTGTSPVCTDGPVALATDPLTGEIALTGAGNTFAGQYPMVSLSPELLNDCVFGQITDGRFLGMGDQDGSGDTRLWLSTGYKTGTLTRVNSSAASVASGGLQDTAAAEIGTGSAGKIVNAWPVTNGDILMMTRASLVDTYHLFRLKANNNAMGVASSVGSDASYSNKKAILDIGRLVQGSGAHSVGITALSNRSFCEATINNAKVYLFAEYNINGARVSGSTDDQVRVWKSTDSGANWTKLLEFNTDGTHKISHFHAVIQDPYTKWVYFLTGDIGTENSIIAWDGVSAAPAANSALSVFATTAGWKVISGSELNRHTDLCFGPAGIYSIPDADTEAYETTSTAYVGVTLPKTLDFVSMVTTVSRLDLIPPLMAVRSSQGWAAFVSFRTTGAAEDYLHLWIQDDANGYRKWRLANKIRNYLTPTSRTANFWFGTDGALYLCGRSGQSTQFSSAAKLSTSVRFTPIAYTATEPNVFDGV